MAVTPAQDSAVAEAPKPIQSLTQLPFIPFRRSDLLRMLRAEGALPADAEAVFDDGVVAVEQAFAARFHALREQIKEHYAPFDPDADTRLIEGAGEPTDEAAAELRALLEKALRCGNYRQLSDEDLRRAFRSASLFQIRLRVRLRDFSDVVIYCRGARQRTETLKWFMGLFSRQVRFTSYDRVLLYLRFADQGQGSDEDFHPGRVMIKLFQNVPDADLEMLFPNTRVGMRWIDRLLIGVPAVASGVVVATTKLGTPLLLLAALFGYWMGLHDEPAQLDRRGLLVIGAGFGALGAYIWKQWSSYRSRKARFRQALTRNLYFKLLDNNAGVLLRVLDDAEDSECKEAFTALYFLLCAPGGMSAAELDERIESWFATRWDAHLDFEVGDALDKLADLGLAARQGERWQACAPAAPAPAANSDPAPVPMATAAPGGPADRPESSGL